MMSVVEMDASLVAMRVGQMDDLRVVKSAACWVALTVECLVASWVAVMVEHSAARSADWKAALKDVM